MDFLNDDENVKAMRETAREVGLTQLLLQLHASADLSPADRTQLRQALQLLGAGDNYPPTTPTDEAQR